MWEAVFDALRDPIFVFDPQGRPTRANAAAIAAFGLPQQLHDAADYEQMVRALDLRTLDGRALDPSDWPSRRALRGAPVATRAYRVHDRDGRDLVVEISAAAIHHHGATVGAVSVWRDVTREHAVEQARREGEARYRRLSENMLEGFGAGEVLFDQAGTPCDVRFDETNAAFERHTGLGREILGRPIRSVLPQLEPQWTDMVTSVALGGIPQRMEGHNADTGRDYEVFCYSPSKGRFAILFRDVSRERRVERELRELTQRLTYHVDHSPLAVIEWGADMRLTRWAGEAERLFGWRAEEVLGKRIEDLRWVYAEDERQVADVAKVLRTGTDRRRFSANRNYRKDGSVVWCEWYNSSLVDERGELRSILSLVLDVTDRVRLEEELRAHAARLAEANRLKDEFLATLSHELRTPLNAILGWAHMLASADLEPDVIRRAAQAVYRNAQAQNQLVDDVLDVSRIINGKLRLDIAPVRLGTLVEYAIESVQAAADAKGLRLSVSGAAEAGVIAGDADRLQQVFWNLLVNAVKFTPAGGEVAVRIARAGADAVEVSVQDSGVGISPEFLPHVFERFTQADSSTTRQHGGLGLGLALVRHLVELHGGSASAESAGEGQGATFRVRLPVVQAERPRRSEPEEREAAPTGPRASSGQLQGVRVLLVDDEADGREMVSALLDLQGAVVCAAASAEEALRMLAAEPPDVMLTDIGMPGTDGYELMRRVRALPREAGGGVPAVALTGYGRPEDRVRALQAGFQQHVPKPVTPDELLAVLVSVVGRGDR